MAGWIVLYVVGCFAVVMLLTSVVNRGAHQHQPDPVVSREFAYRIRKVHRALNLSFAMFGVTILAMAIVWLFQGEIAGLVVLFSAFTVLVIVFVVAAPIVNNNYRCPACGERPTRGNGVRIAPRIRECEECGVILE